MDKIKRLNKQLKEVKQKYDALKKCGIDEEILIVWLQHKTHLNKKKITELLKDVDIFFNKLIKNAIVDELEKKE